MSRSFAFMLLALAAGCSPATTDVRAAAPRATTTADKKQSTEPPPGNETLLLAFTGDVSFYGRDNPAGDELPEAADPLAPMRSVLTEADLTVVNLESVLVRSQPERVRGHPTLWAPPVWAESLVRAGIDVVGTANNHSYDASGQGLLESLATLEGAGLRAIGTGPTRERAVEPHIHPTPGGCVAIVPATTFVNAPIPEDAFAAHDPTRRRILAQVRATAERCPFVVVYLHWGPQFVDMPTRNMRYFAHRLVRAGADLVVAHHPHVLMGVEFRGDAAIAYSLGNFVFSSSRPMTLPTGVLLARLELSPEPHLVGLELAPAMIDRETHTPHPAGERSRVMRRHLERISRPFGTETELVSGRIQFRRRVPVGAAP